MLKAWQISNELHCTRMYLITLVVFNFYLVITEVANVTGYWKTDRIVTLGLFHFIGPADSYTHTLPVHCCIDRPS